MGKLLNKCPVCGGKIEFHSLYQYEYVYTIKQNGQLSKTRRKQDVGSMECGFISCSACDFTTDCDINCESHPDIQIWQKGEMFYYEDDKD